MLRTPFTTCRRKGLYLAILPIYGGEKMPILRLLRNMSYLIKIDVILFGAVFDGFLDLFNQ
jgi:hypothetical protein